MDGFRLSPQQKHLWLTTGGSATLSFSFEINLALEKKALHRALLVLATRHEILRTDFVCPEEATIPVQVIAENPQFNLELGGDQQAVDPCEPLYGQGPWLRVWARPVGEASCEISLRMSALCGDTLSAAHLAGELTGFYRAICNGQDPDAFPQDEEAESGIMQYADLAEVFHELLISEDSKAGLDYWQQHHFEAAGASGPFQTARLSLPKSLVSLLVGQADPELLLEACWSALWQRLDPAGNCARVHSGRSFEELEEAVGLFSRPIPHKNPAGQNSFNQMKAALAGVANDAEYQDYFSWNQVKTTGDGEPHGRYLFMYADVAESLSDDIAAFRVHHIPDRFGYCLAAVRTPEGLNLDLFYDSTLADARQAGRISSRLESLLSGALQSPDRPMEDQSLLGGPERTELLYSFNETAREWAEAPNYYSLLEQAFSGYGDLLALSDGVNRITYKELSQRVELLAAHLAAAGVGPDVAVGVCMLRSIDLVVALAAIARAGGAYVPLTPTYPEERLRFMIEDSRISILITSGDFVSRFSQTGLTILSPDSLPQESPAPAPPCLAGPEHIAYIIYTSGSTGKPKGVMVPHRGVVNYLNYARETYLGEPAGGAPLHSSIGFDLSVTSLWLPLVTGRGVHLVEETDPVGTLQALGRTMAGGNDFDLIKLTPAHMEVLSQMVPQEQAAKSARAFVIGGEALHEATLSFWRNHAPASRLINEYGPTEATVGCCVYQSDRALDLHSVPIGRPITNTSLYVLNPAGEPVCGDETGELYIGGLGLARGYQGRAGLTAERFVPNPFAATPGQRLYRTGDQVQFLPDGNLYYLGRFDNQVKVHGYRIELGEIEAVLTTHESIREAAVVVQEHQQGHAMLMAFITCPPESTAGKTQLQDSLQPWLLQRLPEFMVPAGFEVLDELPLTVNGKVDRTALANRETRARGEYVAPRNEVEASLAEIWAGLLGYEQIGIKDNFFRLGGDSILCIQSVSRARQAGLIYTPRQVFEFQTIAELAPHVKQGGALVVDQGPVTGAVPLGPVQKWFFQMDSALPHHFNHSFMFQVPADLDHQRLEHAIGVLRDHHDMLRARFPLEEGNRVQILEQPGGPVPLLKMRLENGDFTSAAASFQAGFDLEKGPLFRVILLQSPVGDRLLFLCHHLLVDGFSWRVLMEDFNHLYSNPKVALPAKTTSFKSFVERLSEYASFEAITNQAQIWRDMIAGEVGGLPADLNDPASVPNRVSEQETLSVTLDEENTRALLVETPQAYNTGMDDALLAAFILASSSWLGRDELVVHLEGHGRESLFEDMDLSRTVGWFTAIYPVRLSRAAGGDVGATLKNVKERLRSVPDRGLGYGLLRYLAGDESLGEGQAAVSFNYHGQVDAVLEQAGWLKPATESMGPQIAAEFKRAYQLDINAVVVNGQLVMNWTFCNQIHKRETIQALANECLLAARAIIDHCRHPESGGYTPSDFAEANMDQDELDSVLDEIDIEF